METDGQWPDKMWLIHNWIYSQIWFIATPQALMDVQEGRRNEHGVELPLQALPLHFSSAMTETFENKCNGRPGHEGKLCTQQTKNLPSISCIRWKLFLDLDH